MRSEAVKRACNLPASNGFTTKSSALAPMPSYHGQSWWAVPWAQSASHIMPAAFAPERPGASRTKAFRHPSNRQQGASPLAIS